ncbi:MAG: LPS export ABC transporter ATP-binding protein [Elusimicrobia bacterium]|nr:LPS export ABC transporter ATP-binding protein [Elusimicrobiota bacterium]
MKLQAEGLVKRYRQRLAVDQVTLAVAPGEIVGLLGPNGAGKTTTFDMIVGLTTPDAGEVFVDGQSVTGWPMYRRARWGLAYLPQEPSIFRRLTVEENLWVVLEFLPISDQARREKAERLLAELGLDALRQQLAGTLSGGEKRRCEIARALVTDPRFLLLDEPFVGIDPIAVADIQRIISQLKGRGIGILMTDHNVRDTLDVVDRAFILYEGRILREGKAKDLVADPVARQVYLGEKIKL